MRKAVKTIAGWLHATLILAILPPLLYVMGAGQRSGAGRTLYFRCLLIAVPVAVTGVAVKKCKGLVSYLLACGLVFAATGLLARAAAGGLWRSGEAAGYIVLLLAETLFVIVFRMLGRLHKKREKETLLKEDPNMEPESERLAEPSFPMLLLFPAVYAIALNLDSPELCNAALFSAAVYGVNATLYYFVQRTERYLSLNKRTCNLPSKRIYGIGGGMLAIFLLLLLVAALPSFLTVSARKYRDCREMTGNWVADLPPVISGPGAAGNGEDMADWMEALGERESASVPVWVEALFYGIGIMVLLFLTAIWVKAVFGMFRTFREARDENGDIVEELEEPDTRYSRIRAAKEPGRRDLTEREKIRKQYRKFIRKHRKERPAVYETPAEIEEKAGVAEDEEGKALHGKYERARYSAYDG